MLEMLDLYYDSQAVKLQEKNLKETVKFDINFELVHEKNWGSDKICYKFKFKDHELKSLLKTINNYVEPDFFVSLGGHNPTQFETFFIKCNFEHEDREVTFEFKLDKEKDTDFEPIMAEAFKTFKSIPKSGKFSFIVNRKPNYEYREAVLAANSLSKLTGSREDCKTIQTYGQKFFNPELIDRYAGRDLKNFAFQGYRCYNSPFKGVLKSEIFDQNKEGMLFLIEYIYGEKIAKNKRLGEIAAILAKLDVPTKVYDIREISKVKSAIHQHRGVSIPSLYKKLALTQLKPQSDLKRWNKKYKLDQLKLNTEETGDN